MKPKKTEKANLENKRGLFLQVGLILTMALTLLAFEWYSPYEVEKFSEVSTSVFDELDATVITRPDENKVKPPPRVFHRPVVVSDITDVDALFDPTDLLFDFNPDPVYLPEIEEPDPFIPVEIMPKYKGGDENTFWKDVYSRLNYPQVAQDRGIEGTVFVSFIINKEGDLTDIKITRSNDPVFSEEVLRVLKESDKWTPGMQRNKKVKVGFRMSFKFRLQ